MNDPVTSDEWVSSFASSSQGDDATPTPEMLLASIGPPPPPLANGAASDRPKFRRVIPSHSKPGQGLMLLWCCFLLGSWLVTLRHGPSLGGIRWMVFAAAIGLMVVWPVIRLSQSFRDEPREGEPSLGRELSRARIALMTLIDWLRLMMVLQVVIWPLRLSAGWSLRQVVVLDLALAAWSLLTGALVALGCMSGRGLTRTICMIACLSLLLFEPVLMALMNTAVPMGRGFIWTMRISPIQVLWMSSDASANWVMRPWIDPLLGAGAAALVAWVIVLIAALRKHPDEE